MPGKQGAGEKKSWVKPGHEYNEDMFIDIICKECENPGGLARHERKYDVRFDPCQLSRVTRKVAGRWAPVKLCFLTLFPSHASGRAKGEDDTNNGFCTSNIHAIEGPKMLVFFF
jgi:hypothetical protein